MSARKPNLSAEEIARPFNGELAGQFPVILSTKRLAELLGVSLKTLYEWMSKGRLDGTYRKRGKRAWFWRDKVLDLFNGKEWN